MKCPICGKDVELQKKQVGVDEQGAPVFHQYAVCRDCKKQWDLDKQRARKVSPGTAANAGKAEPSVIKPEKSSKEETAPEAVSKHAAPKKNLAGEEKKEPKEEASPGERPVRRKPSSGQVAPQKKAQENHGRKKESAQDTSFRSVSLEKEAPQKAAPKELSAERKVSGKPTSGGSPADKKALRKTGDGDKSSAAKVARKPASGTTLPERRSRNSESQKSSAEKSGSSRPASGKRPSAGSASEKVSAERVASGKPPVKKRPSGEGVRPNEEAVSTGTLKKKPVRKRAAESEEQHYGNIPPEKVRVKKEHAVKQGYEDMLSTDPNHKPKKKKKPLPDEDVQPVKKEHHVPVKQRPAPKVDMDDEYDEEDMDYEEIPARFRIPRVIFGIISIVAAGFFAYGGFFEGLENIASGSTISTGTTFIIFAICMLVSGLLLLIMQNRNTILAFILPMIFYFGAAVFTFLKRQDKQLFLYCAIAAAVLGFIFLVLGIISRNSNSYGGEDDYDDPFEEDYE